MGFDKHFGFNTTQKKTLDRLLAEAGLTSEQAAAVQAVVSLPTADPEVDGAIWNDGGVLKTSLGN